ncbi:MAG: glycosyltransferase family 2 protein [Muribaculaceae bacterium]|nr:glycosyltransferase family 2 protein [Muribaculaceae bacterium]
MYGGQDYIARALDSIYSQGLDLEDFEVLVVDDACPDKTQNLVVEDYIAPGDDSHPTNLHLLTYADNRRQGGARNFGVAHSQGDWILYLDQDDEFVVESLQKLAELLKENSELDLLMCNAGLLIEETGEWRPHHYPQRNKQGLMTGEEFMVIQEVPWSPWYYAYSRKFIERIDLRFEEHVRFEDRDYVMRATINADKIMFVPLDLYCHHEYALQTTMIGNDKQRIHDNIYMSDRCRVIAEKERSSKPRGAEAIMNHYRYGYNAALKRYLWRLSANDIVEILGKYPPPLKSGGLMMRLAAYPHLFAIISLSVRPILLSLWHLKRFLKKFN